MVTYDIYITLDDGRFFFETKSFKDKDEAKDYGKTLVELTTKDYTFYHHKMNRSYRACELADRKCPYCNK